MERVIYEIDVHVDKTLGCSEETFTDAKGRAHSMLTHRLMIKYFIIFQVAENLPREVKIMKNYICQAASDILTDVTKLMDVSDFMTNLSEEFTKRGILSDYKTFPIPASKKKLAVNGAEVKEDKKENKKAAKDLQKEY